MYHKGKGVDVINPIKQDAPIQEDYRSDDLFEAGKTKKAIKQKISEIKAPATLALVGKFGTGKSTILYQLEREKTDDEVWLHFDAWKYPDRSDLWEGLVLDIADQLGQQKSTKKRLDGSSRGGQVVDIVSDIASLASGIPGLNIFDKLINVFKSSPAKRVFEIQNILKELLSISGGLKIKLVVEDIDRSGDSGVYFLETLNHFLKNTQLENEVIVIAPISDTSYQDKLDSYLKCIDYFEFFNHSIKSLKAFTSKVFNEELFEGELRDNDRVIWTGKKKEGQLISFLEYLFQAYPNINGRVLKLIIRDFAATYAIQVQDGHNPDWRVTLCIQASKYIKNNEQTYFDQFKNTGHTGRPNVFTSYLYAMYSDADSIVEFDHQTQLFKLIESPYVFKFFERQDDNEKNYPSYPYAYGGFRTDGLAICSFYLNY